MREHNNFKYTCLFGGGAIRGAAHVGVLKALKELDIELTTLAGSSVGSMVAALCAVGYSPEEVSDVFLSVNFELFRDISFGFNQKFAISKGEVFLDWIRELIERKYYGDSYQKGQSKKVCFKDLDRNLVVITTNLNTCSCREFSTFETPDFEVAMAVRISCCMPGLMRALTVDDDLLVDGDLLKGKPMWTLSKHLKNTPNRVLEIRLEGSYAGSAQSPLEYVNGMYTCMTSAETSFIKSVYGKQDNIDCLVIDAGNVVVVDFNHPLEKRLEIIDRGYKQTKDYFNNYLVLKKQKILEIYSDVLDKLRHVQSLFLLRKYIAAKNAISDMFVYLYSADRIIDSELSDALSLFHKLVSNNVKKGLLGRESCLNIDAVRNSLHSIIDDLTVRVKELERYLDKFSD